MQITTVISIISLLIALTTFFLTQLQPARLSSQSGPFIKIYYAFLNALNQKIQTVGIDEAA